MHRAAIDWTKEKVDVRDWRLATRRDWRMNQEDNP
jgi:hypothetical protein